MCCTAVSQDAGDGGGLNRSIVSEVKGRPHSHYAQRRDRLRKVEGKYDFTVYKIKHALLCTSAKHRLDKYPDYFLCQQHRQRPCFRKK